MLSFYSLLSLKIFTEIFVSYKIARVLRLRFIWLESSLRTAEVKKMSGFYAKGQNLNKEITGI